jgi:peroxiredoxin
MVLLESSALEYGKPIKDFNLPDTVNGANFSNKNLSRDVAVIAFICNHCPYVIRIIDDFSALAARLKSQVDFVTISANDPDYRQEDSPENMTKFARAHKFTFPYLFDESQDVARDFGAVCTPDIFVYIRRHPEEREARRKDPVYKLAYHARFEDLAKAIDDLLKQDTVSFE